MGLFNPVRRFVIDETAQDLIEYGFLVGLIALLAVGGVTLVGTSIPPWYAAIQVALAAVPL